MKLKSIVLLSILFMKVVSATEYEQKGWVGLFGKKALIDSSYYIWQEVQLRYDFEKGEMGQSLIRFGALKTLNEQHEVGALFGYITTGASSKEYRPTLQHVYTKKSDNNLMLFRSRLEWRDLENNSTNSVRLRLMPNFRWEVAEKKSFSVWNEFFINATRESWTGDRFIERNRLFLGLRHEITGTILEYGYLNQYIPRHARDISEHIMVINLYF